MEGKARSIRQSIYEVYCVLLLVQYQYRSSIHLNFRYDAPTLSTAVTSAPPTPVMCVFIYGRCTDALVGR